MVVEQPQQTTHSPKARVDWTQITAFVSALGLLLTGGGLFYTASQLRLSRQIAKSEFMREYYQTMQQYNDLQRKLVQNGEWRATETSGPSTDEEWFELQRYMGLLEQAYQNYRDGIIDLEHMDSAYSHRVKAIATHPLIKKRLLEDQAYRWGHFLKLVEILSAMPLYRQHAYTHPADAGRVFGAVGH